VGRFKPVTVACYNHLVCTGSCLLSNFIEKLLQGAVYFFPILPCLSSNPLETLSDTINFILHPGHVNFIVKRETWSLWWAFIIGIPSRAWALCRGFSWMRMDALLDGFTINGNATKDMWDHFGTPCQCSFTDCVEYIALTKSYTWLSTPLWQRRCFPVRYGKRLQSFLSRLSNGSEERWAAPFSYRREVRKFSFGLTGSLHLWWLGAVRFAEGVIRTFHFGLTICQVDPLYVWQGLAQLWSITITEHDGNSF